LDCGLTSTFTYQVIMMGVMLLVVVLMKSIDPEELKAAQTEMAKSTSSVAAPAVTPGRPARNNKRQNKQWARHFEAAYGAGGYHMFSLLSYI
jgi:hypothetical protein